MRDVLRRVFDAAVGVDWLDGLSEGARKGIERSANIARTQRPDETLGDDWDAVGIREIDATLRSIWQRLNGALTTVWPDQNAATVDLDRLRAYRGKNLHAVGPPDGQIRDEEMGAMVLRLRIGFEGLRRHLANDEGEWWPYIEAVHSNIPEFCLDRTTGLMGNAVLSEGDLVRFEIVGVHPQGPQDRLRYRLTARGGHIPDSGWVERSEFHVSVPRQRTVRFILAVADADDLTNRSLRMCSCRVRPAERAEPGHQAAVMTRPTFGRVLAV